MDSVIALGGADCERIGTGLLAQPINAVSALAYGAAAVAVVVPTLRAKGKRRALLAAYAGALAAVAVGSFAYHGPQPTWAGWAHDVTAVLAVGLGLAVVLATPTLLDMARPAARPVWIVLAAAVLAYVAGRTGARTCMPSSVLQPHAAWHLLSAAGAALVARTPPREIRANDQLVRRSDGDGNPIDSRPDHLRRLGPAVREWRPVRRRAGPRAHPPDQCRHRAR
jgi:hypothetical protein